MQKKNMSTTATVAILRELFSKYGFPVHCVSDNGPQFRSEEFAHFLKMNGVKHIRVVPYPQPVADWPKKWFNHSSIK